MQRNKRCILVLDEKKNNKKANSKICILSNGQGITLIALVISIIVMLILAGVSLNATIGENGIMAQAKNATYVQGIASLEEYLNQFYVENYEDLKDSEDKAEALSNYSKSSSWFYKTANGYVVDKNGKINYFLKVENLPERSEERR